MSVLRHEFYETDESLTVSVFDRGVDPANVKVNFGPRSLEYKHESSALVLQPLKGEINPIASTYTVGKLKVEMRLVKIVSGRWGLLIGETPDVLAQPFDPLDSSSASTSSESRPRKPKKNWDNITTTILSQEKEKTLGEDPNAGGDVAVNGFFQKLYDGADEDTKRAMMKSYVESGGTALNTNWSEVGTKKVEVKPPQGSEYKRWG